MDAANEQCAICKKYSNASTDVLNFGDWLRKSELKVHHFCLLLSTHLPQRGVNDWSGILGFLVTDIRREIAAAARRQCFTCSKPYASVMCQTCKKFFHVSCGRLTGALFRFVGEFPSFCADCMPLDDHQRAALKASPDSSALCSICAEALGRYKPARWIHAPCCGNGYAHRICMQKFAMEAGYYLRCIWCRDTQFRQLIPMFGIFVPDRDAQWENTGRYRDLHRGHGRCDMPQCHSAKGRDFISKKWPLLLCSLCGSCGAHTQCLVPPQHAAVKEFKCNVCTAIERRRLTDENGKSAPNADAPTSDNIDTSIFALKQKTEAIESKSLPLPCFSDEGSFSSESSVQTVIRMPASRIVALAHQTQIERVRGGGTPAKFPDVKATQEVTPTLKDAASLTSPTQASDCPTVEPIGKSQVPSDVVTFKAYEFDELWRCVDTATVQINVKDVRFCGKSVEEIKNSTEPLLNEKDVIDRHDDIDVWSEINAIIDEYAD